MVEEYKRPDIAPGMKWQHATDEEAASQVAPPGLDNKVNGIGHLDALTQWD
jgi:hypothetical protein